MKQNSKKKKKGNEVLHKYLVAVGEFVKSKSGADEEEHDHGLRFVKKKSRKELRKEKRKTKKAKMKSYYEGNKVLVLPQGEEESGKKKKKSKAVSKAQESQPASASTEKTVKSKVPPPPKKGKKLSKLQESRKMALLEANEQEDREIKKLERCLGLNRRKNKKTLPQSFVADGLDYILGMLDSGASAEAMMDEDDDMDMARANFEKLDDDDNSEEDGEAGDKVASEGSDEDMASFEEEEEDDDDDNDEDDDLMADEGEREEEEEDKPDDDQDELDDGDENEGETEEEADAPDTNASETTPETVELAYCKSTFHM